MLILFDREMHEKGNPYELSKDFAKHVRADITQPNADRAESTPIFERAFATLPPAHHSERGRRADGLMHFVRSTPPPSIFLQSCFA